jgi:hypothetical protein
MLGHTLHALCLHVDGTARWIDIRPWKDGSGVYSFQSVLNTLCHSIFGRCKRLMEARLPDGLMHPLPAPSHPDASAWSYVVYTNPASRDSKNVFIPSCRGPVVVLRRAAYNQSLLDRGIWKHESIEFDDIPDDLKGCIDTDAE